MPITESDVPVEVLREDLRHLPGPYLLRKYDATEEDYEEIADDDLRCEFIDGVLIVHSPASSEHEERIVFLSTLLANFVLPKRLGNVYGSNAVMQLGHRRFCSDVSFLAKTHAARMKNKRVIGPMDLVVEMISESTRDYDFGDKRDCYHKGKVPEIWFVDADQRRWTIDCLEGRKYRSRSLSKGRFASRVLPGLTLDVSWIWTDPLPNPLECIAISPSG